MKAQSNQGSGLVKNDAYRAENERILVDGVVQNQEKLIDNSHDIASQEAERRRVELEYRANAGGQILEMEQKRLEAQQQQQKWAQEQYEKDRQQYEKERQMREAQARAEREKRSLCNIYISERRYAEARETGCNY